MTRSVADVEIPNYGPSCRIVKFIRQYAAIGRTRSSSAKPKGLLRPVPLHRTAAR